MSGLPVARVVTAEFPVIGSLTVGCLWPRCDFTFLSLVLRALDNKGCGRGVGPNPSVHTESLPPNRLCMIEHASTYVHDRGHASVLNEKNSVSAVRTTMRFIHSGERFQKVTSSVFGNTVSVWTRKANPDKKQLSGLVWTEPK